MKPIKLLPWVISLTIAWLIGFYYNTSFGGLVGWMRKTYEQKITLAGNIKAEKRLILVGGSGVNYTFNSEYLTNKLGFPVFNMGLDGKLGLDVILPLISEQIKQGDIVLLVPEYLMLLDDDGLGTISTHFTVAINQPTLTKVSAKKFLEDTWMLGLPGLKSIVKSGVDLTTKGYFDEYYADPITPWGEPTKVWTRNSKWRPMDLPQTITPHSVESITKFKQNVEAKGGTLILSLPIIYGQTDEITMNNVRDTATKLAQIAPLIYDQKTLNVWTDSSLFAETHYHLSPQARILRSQEVIEQLQPILTQLGK